MRIVRAQVAGEFVVHSLEQLHTEWQDGGAQYDAILEIREHVGDVFFLPFRSAALFTIPP